MSGYQAIDEPLLRLDNSTFVAFGDLERCVYVIQDGQRIALKSYACVELDTDLYFGVSKCMESKSHTPTVTDANLIQKLPNM